MAKMILVLDEMPNNCIDCPIFICTHIGEMDECPLKEMPKREGCDGTSIDSWEGGYRAGWNACLDKIGGGEGTGDGGRDTGTP